MVPVGSAYAPCRCAQQSSLLAAQILPLAHALADVQQFVPEHAWVSQALRNVGADIQPCRSGHRMGAKEPGRLVGAPGVTQASGNGRRGKQPARDQLENVPEHCQEPGDGEAVTGYERDPHQVGPFRTPGSRTPGPSGRPSEMSRTAPREGRRAPAGRSTRPS